MRRKEQKDRHIQKKKPFIMAFCFASPEMGLEKKKNTGKTGNIAQSRMLSAFCITCFILFPCHSLQLGVVRNNGIERNIDGCSEVLHVGQSLPVHIPISARTRSG